MLLNCGVGEDSFESLELQGDPTKSFLKKISPEYSLELSIQMDISFPFSLPLSDGLDAITIVFLNTEF